jgi:hypothetical protein
MLIKILSLIVNFNLIFQPLTFNLYLSSLLNSKAQAQDTTSDYPQFEVEIVPIATASSTDIVRWGGGYYCNPYEGNITFPSKYIPSGEEATVIQKVKDVFLSNGNNGCESIWPQILFRFKTATSYSDLLNFLKSYYSNAKFNIKINLKFRDANGSLIDKDLNLEYYTNDGNDNVMKGENNNISISGINGYSYINENNISTATDPYSNKEYSYFDLYLSLRSHYYFRDEPYLDPIIDYATKTKHVTTTHPEFPKRFIIKSISFEVNGQNLIKNVKFFKDAKSYGDYLEGVENSVDIEVSTTTFENLEDLKFNNDDKLKGIVGFFPAFIESLPQSLPDTIFGDACRYYSEKENGPIILLPYQFAAVYSVSVSATGTCDQPPEFNNGINPNEGSFCFKFTNRTVPCEIVSPGGPLGISTSPSLCMTGLPLYNKFYNGYYYLKNGTSQEYWNINEAKGYRIIRKINNRIDKFPNAYLFFSSLNNASNTDDVQNAINQIQNDPSFKDLFKNRRIFSYQKLLVSSSSKLTYYIFDIEQLFGIKENEFTYDYLAKRCDLYGVFKQLEPPYGDTQREFDVFKCSSPIGNILVGFLPHPLKQWKDHYYETVWDNKGTVLGYGGDFLALGSDLGIFIKPLDFSFHVAKNTEVVGSSLILNQPSIKYELSILNYLPRLYTDDPVSYRFKAVSPFSIKNGTLVKDKDSYFQYNDFSPNTIFGNTFNSFYKFTSLCTLPQAGFEVGLNFPSTIVDYVTTTQCDISGRCWEEQTPVYSSLINQCFNTATATISASWNITYYTKQSQASAAEKEKGSLDNLAALYEYHEKGKNVSRIKFEIAEIASSSNSTRILPVVSLEYERKYIPPPYLKQYIDYINRYIWGEQNLPQPIASTTDEQRHRIVQEVFSNLPIFLSLKKKNITPNSNISIENIPENINLNVFSAQIDWTKYTYGLPAAYAFLKVLSTGLKALFIIFKAASFLVGGSLGLTLASISEYIFLFALVEDFTLLTFFPEYNGPDAWLMFALDSIMFFATASLTADLRQALSSGINWIGGNKFEVGKGFMGEITDLLDKLGISGAGVNTVSCFELLRGPEENIQPQFPQENINNLNQYSKINSNAFAQTHGYRDYVCLLPYYTSDKWYPGYYDFLKSYMMYVYRKISPMKISPIFQFRVVYPKNEKINLQEFSPQQVTNALFAPVNFIALAYPSFYKQQKALVTTASLVAPIVSQFLISNKTFQEIAPYIIIGGAVFTILTGMVTLFNLGKMYRDLTKEYEEYEVKSIGISYGYKIEGITVNATTENKTYAPIFTLIGRPVFDPDYPEYGYYEPVKRFYGVQIQVGNNCKTFSCIFNENTATIIPTTSQNASLKDFNIESIENEEYIPYCNDRVVKKQNKTENTQIVSTSKTYNIATSSSDYIGFGIMLKSFLSKLILKFNDQNSISDIASGTNPIPLEFQYPQVTTTTHLFVKNTTTDIKITTNEWWVATNTVSSTGYQCTDSSGRHNFVIYNVAEILKTINYKINCAGGTKLKWKGMDVANTCLGWVCEYEPQWQPSLQEVTTTPNK